MKNRLPLASLILFLSGCALSKSNGQGNYSLTYQGRSERLTLKSGAYMQVTTINGSTTTQTGKYTGGDGTGSIQFDSGFMAFYNDEAELMVEKPHKTTQNFQMVCSSDCTIYVSDDLGIQYEQK